MHRLRYHSSAPVTPPLGPPSALFPGAHPEAPPAPHPGPAGPAPQDTDPTPAQKRSKRRAAVLGVVIAALLGGGAFAVVSTREDPPSNEELTALAQRAALVASDFPNGWTADPAEPPSEAAEEADRALAECLGAPYDDAPDAADTGFSAEGGMSATSEFSIAPTLAFAKAEFATLSDVAAPSCFEKVLRRLLDADREPGDIYTVKVTRLDAASLVPRKIAPDTAGFRANITLRRATLVVPMTFEFVMIRHDRIGASLSFNSVGSEGFPGPLMQSLTSAVVGRLTS